MENFSFLHEYTSPSALLDSFSANNLPPCCGQIVIERQYPNPNYRVKKLSDGVTRMVGPQGKELRDIHPEFPDQISSHVNDTWQAVVLLRSFPWATAADIFNRMIKPKSSASLSNRINCFYKSNGGNFSIIAGTQTTAPKTQMEKLEGLLVMQMNRNTCWTLSTDLTKMRQPKSTVWYDVPCPEGDFLSKNSRLRGTLTELNRYRDRAREDTGKEEDWAEYVPDAKRGTKKVTTVSAIDAKINKKRKRSDGE